MSEMGFQFHTTAFGGFRKQDVLNYLERSTREHAEKIAVVQRELAEVKEALTAETERRSAMEIRSVALQGENQRLAADLAERETALTEAVARRDELEELVAKLREQVEKLGPSAAAYEGIKNRTAGIELEAHSRAQVIEQEGHERVKKAQEQLLAWFAQVEAAYSRLRSDVDATLAHASREMERTGMNLESMKGELASHDEGLGQLKKQIDSLLPQVPEPLDPKE